MSTLPRRAIAAVLLLALVATACSNSSKASGESDGGGDGGGGNGGEESRDEFVELSGVPGVSDDEITFAAIGTKTGNPLGTCILDCYVEGIEAYFAFRNSEGGIYGRDLVLGEVLDDELAQNQVRALDVVSSDDAFGVFEATLLATGWGDLDSAGIPTYAWGIHSTEAADRPHVFPSTVVRCASCLRKAVPYVAQEVGATKAASIGYGVSENSKECTSSSADSYELFAEDTGVELGYENDDLEYGLPNGIGPEVTAMKEAGVDFISTCIDLNGMKTLAQELERQGMDDVVLMHPNTYDQRFVQEAGTLFEGDVVGVQFRPFEAEVEGTALADFEQWMEEQGSERTELAMVGWINASLAFEGLLAAGPEFDREAVTSATNALTDFTADGMLEPVDWTVAHTPYTWDEAVEEDEGECGAFVKVEGGEFVTLAPPETPWLCWTGDPTVWSEPEPMSFD
ncbi:MAG TPA: ABC transporter substrate-binding protein [Iamia sp.]